jgi:hypothetical protein
MYGKANPCLIIAVACLLALAMWLYCLIFVAEPDYPTIWFSFSGALMGGGVAALARRRPVYVAIAPYVAVATSLVVYAAWFAFSNGPQQLAKDLPYFVIIFPGICIFSGGPAALATLAVYCLFGSAPSAASDQPRHSK